MRDLRMIAKKVVKEWNIYPGSNEMANAMMELEHALSKPSPPVEALTEAEQIAYCAGWWAAIETKRKESV